MDKQRRFQQFISDLGSASPASDAGGAMELISTVLNTVEDQLSGVPYNPAAWMSDGRMYPPQPDSARSVENFPSITRYRNKSHNTYIQDNGAIRIEALPSRTIVLDKAGSDGKKVFE